MVEHLSSGARLCICSSVHDAIEPHFGNLQNTSLGGCVNKTVTVVVLCAWSKSRLSKPNQIWLHISHYLLHLEILPNMHASL